MDAHTDNIAVWRQMYCGISVTLEANNRNSLDMHGNEKHKNEKTLNSIQYGKRGYFLPQAH